MEVLLSEVSEPEFRPRHLAPWPRLEVAVLPKVMPNAGGGGGVPSLGGSCLRILGKGGRPEPRKRVYDKDGAAQGKFSQTCQALPGVGPGLKF